jgi:putative transcriptional regulator
MNVSYNGLWKLLIDKNLQKKDLLEDLKISSSTIAKMGKGQEVSLSVIKKICEYLNCDIGDIVSLEEQVEDSDSKKGK